MVCAELGPIKKLLKDKMPCAANATNLKMK
jgi:hypothetical protein